MTTTHEPILNPPPGMYLLCILMVYITKTSQIIYYDFAVGDYVGWAHEAYMKTGKWILKQRIDLTNGSIPYKCLMTAINSDPQYATVSDLKQAVGCRVCAQLINVNYDGKQYMRVAKTYPASKYNITPGDIRIGTGSWAVGTPDVNRASYIAHYSGLPVLLADAQERKSPMVGWCAENRIALLPMVFPAGDYRIPDGSVIVDRKENILEIYHNFSHSQNRASYERAAVTAASLGCQLIYVIAVDPKDHITGLDDLSSWQEILPNGSVASGINLYKQLINYTLLYPNSKFIFVERDRQCETIWGLLQQ